MCHLAGVSKQMSFGDYKDCHTRAEHVAWAKERALGELDRKRVSAAKAIASALASMTSDLNKHPDTQDHVGNEQGFRLILGGHLSTRDDMRKHIEGYN